MSDLLNFDKTKFLETAKTALQQNLLSVKDIQSLLPAESSPTPHTTKNTNQVSLFIKFLAVFGTLIVVLGVLFLIGLLWDSLGDVGQIAITLGLGVVCFISGTVCLKFLQPRFVGLSLHTVGFFAIPTGIFVSLSKLPSSSVDMDVVVFTVFSILTLSYLLTDYLLKSKLFTLATFIFGSIAYWAGVFTLFENDYFFWREIFQRPLLLYGLVLIIPGRILSSNFRAKVFKFFEGIGWISLLQFFWSTLLISGTQTPPINNFVLGAIYTASIFLGLKIKSTTLLVISSIALTGFLCYINFVYFSQYISWPIALIFSGAVLIGAGYFLANSIKKIKE